MFVNELVARYRLAANDRQEPFFLSDSDVIGFLAEAEDQACIRSRLIHESADPDICRIALDTGTDHYDVHPVLFEISNARVKMEGSSQWAPLRMVSVEWLDYHRRDWRDEVGTPAFAVFNHQKLRLVPTPDRAGEVKLEGYRLPKVSITTSPRCDELRRRYTSISVGFIVGCTSFFFGLLNSMTVVCERSAYQSWPAPSFQP